MCLCEHVCVSWCVCVVMCVAVCVGVCVDRCVCGCCYVPLCVNVWNKRRTEFAVQTMWLRYNFFDILQLQIRNS